MKIEILEQKKNPLLKREEVLMSFEHPGRATPSRKEMLPELAKALKSREDLLIIDKIFSVPGKNVSKAKILAYSKKEEIPKEKLEKMMARTVSRSKQSKTRDTSASPDEQAEMQMKPKKGAPAEAPKGEGKPEKPPGEPKPEEKKEENKPEEKKGGE